MKIKLLISYEGSSFQGWQKQLHSSETVQGILETALSQLFGESISTLASGRTDTGVHALGQVVQFIAPKDPSSFTKDFIYSVNSLCPDEIVVHKAWHVPDQFHVIESSVSKTYIYKMYFSPTPSPFFKNRSLWLPQRPSLVWLNQASALLKGTHDFKSFQSTGASVSSTQREIFEIQWEDVSSKNLFGLSHEAVSSQPQVGQYQLTIKGNGFLKQMVRNIVGSLLDLKKQQAAPEAILKILKAQDRSYCTAPIAPGGLYLHSVEYPSELRGTALPRPEGRA